MLGSQNPLEQISGQIAAATCRITLSSDQRIAERLRQMAAGES
jgi:hypothetical protein